MRPLRRGSRTTERTGTPADLLVVGLGNPGAEFEGTRHNVGAEVVQVLARRHGARLKKGKERALVDEVKIIRPAHDPARLALAIPLTYMNDSGQAVALLARRYGVGPEKLVIVHDELDLPAAVLRVKEGGGLAGHNGLRSIKAHLHSDDFLRVRIGVGKPRSKEVGAEHVLDRFSKRDRKLIDVTIEDPPDPLELILTAAVQPP